jgi:predicted CoA-binding protein
MSPQGSDPAEADLRRILTASPVVAVLGIHDETVRAAYYVPAYLHDHGYRILGVNPGLAGRTMFGEPVVATMAELREPIDVLDVFRNSANLRGHLDEMLALAPRVAWFQLGVRDDRVAAALRARGIEVVQDHCMLAEHRRLKIQGAPHRPG